MTATRHQPRLRRRPWLALLPAALLALSGCATRPVNPPLTHADAASGYTYQTRQKHFRSQDNLVVLAFSGGGTRAAAGKIILASPEFQRLLNDLGAKIISGGTAAAAAGAPAP